MSGTGPTPAEQHLGDRLAALVDGELNHDARERVLAHLATCAKCKAEADAQRRLKSVFAQTAPPLPSAGFLARLHSLPGGSSGPGAGEDDEGKGLFEFEGARRFGDGVFGVRPDGFGYVPAGAGGLSGGSGFRIHEVGRQEAERSPWRGRRFAFAAASAVSFAAMALGGTMQLGTADVLQRGAGNSVTPMRAPGTTAPVSVGGESSRRQGGAAGAHTGNGQAPAVPAGVSQVETLSGHGYASGTLIDSTELLIRPTGPAGSALQIDDPELSPTAAPRPTRMDAPTLPVAPLSARR
ncbi:MULTISPECIES: anti-sigma factor family protein [unclassified Streptomyces]|uniref:anti-sigma factor family protein n=1 Tax=unclassified Streptomyces TaxID=2593676 RepID=UPI00382F9EBA